MAFKMYFVFAILLIQKSNAVNVKTDSISSPRTFTQREEPDGHKFADASPLIQSKISQLEARIEQLTNIMEAKLQFYENQMAKFDAKLHFLEREELNNTNMISIALRKPVLGLRISVAFSAFLSHFITGAKAGTTIIFDKVVLNDGGGYNPVTGVFTVPIDGVYQFSSFAMARQYAELYLDFLLNGKLISNVYVDVNSDSHRKNGGSVVIVKANKGDEVKIRCSADTCNIQSWELTRTTTFSGSFLYV